MWEVRGKDWKKPIPGKNETIILTDKIEIFQGLKFPPSKRDELRKRLVEYIKKRKVNFRNRWLIINKTLDDLPQELVAKAQR